MAQLIWTDPALADLDAIGDYIAVDNIQAAQKLVRMVFEAVATLEEFPESGRHPPELESTRYREIIVAPCRIFYRVDGSTVFVLFVMRGEQDLRKFLLRG